MTILEIDKILREKYHSQYFPDSPLSAYDQLLVQEALSEATFINEFKDKEHNANVNGMNNGGCKFEVNSELIQSKYAVIAELKKLRSTSPPNEIDLLLREFFKEWPNTKEGHWLYIAQNYPPRPICRVLEQMLRKMRDGYKTIQSPPAYFTVVMKYRVKRHSTKNEQIK